MEKERKRAEKGIENTVGTSDVRIFSPKAEKVEEFTLNLKTGELKSHVFTEKELKKYNEQREKKHENS